MTAPAPAPKHDAYAALRLPEFRRFILGRFLDVLGSQMLLVVVGWELYERTRSPMALGLVGLARFTPMLVLTLPSGHAADRYDRRRLLMLAAAVKMLASAGLTAASWLQGPVWTIYLCLIVSGTAGAMAGPAYGALSAQIVPRALYANATSWRASMFELASVAGPALGGLLLGATGTPAFVYILDAAGASCFIILLTRIASRPRTGPAEAPGLASLAVGIRFLLRTKVLLAALTLDLFAVLLGGATMLLPVYAKDILHVGPVGLGWLRAAPALGAFAMAVFLAHHGLRRRTGPVLLWSVAGFGVATIVFGLSESYALSAAMLFVAGALDDVSVVIRSTLVQTLTPDEMRGRVGAVNSFFISASNELGAFESGAVAALIGPVGSVVVGGVGTVLVVLAVHRAWPQVARLDTI